MFYYKTSFSKKAIFSEKTVKNQFVGGHDRFEEREASADKNQYNLFYRHCGLEYFSFNNFFEKKKIFRNNSEKLFLGGMTIFEERGRRIT